MWLRFCWASRWVSSPLPVRARPIRFSDSRHWVRWWRLPGILGLLGLVDRAALWLPVGLAAFPLAFLSFAGLTLPLLPLAVIFVVAWVRHPGSHRAPVVHLGAVAPLVVILLLGAAVALFVSEDPASWTTATGGGSTSDVITDREALLSLACTVLALVTGWTLTRTRRASG